MNTGSLMNNLMGGTTPITPEVGMGATVLGWTDRHAATITSVNGKRLTVQLDRATRTDTNGMSDAQSYAYERNPEGRVMEFSLRNNGRWVLRGMSATDGMRLLIGTRQHYHDYSF